MRFDNMTTRPAISIHFDGDSGNTFYGGQLVTGNVHFHTSERIKIRGIRLKVTGEASTFWATGSDKDRRVHTAREKYMDFDVCFIGSPSNDSELYLEPSAYKYPFSFMLPAELPQSFEDLIGRVKYIAKAVVDRRKKSDIKANVEFIVFRLLDLNREPLHLRAPQAMYIEMQAIPCCQCCNGGAIEISATISRGCFVPGDTMTIDGEIVNRTTSRIKYSTISLVQTVKYSATDRDGKVSTTRHVSKDLEKEKRPSLKIGQTDSWKNISWVVPQTVASRLDGCSIINIEYSVQISVNLASSLGKNSALCAIVIGNVPLRDDSQLAIVTSQPVGLPVPCKTCGF